jgi:cytochrome c553
MKISLIVIFVLLLQSFSQADDVRDDKAATEFFERSIRPLLAKHCYECHSAETSAENGHLALDGRNGLISGGDRGPVLVPGKPDESLLVNAVRYADPKLQMPPDGKLSNEEIDLVIRWIERGAFVPEYGDALVKKGKQIDWALAKGFWSFQALSQKPLSIPLNSEDYQPIDGFIRSRLETVGLRPSIPADKRTLIRRLSFDLLGLPPSSQEVAEFTADSHPDAYERLVDRLLASPHFGERWGRYWLDLARYTDVTPSWLKNADQAWLYRDWIVRSINEDRPYDDFVGKQLAADLIEGTPPADYAALGLLGLSPTYWKELKLAPSVIEVIVADEWDERIDAVTRTFLGLTVACARCHDHKFDPITTRDYYALAGMFASTQLTDRPLVTSPLAEQIAAARQRVNHLDESLKPIKDKESEEAKKLIAEIESIRKTTPQFDARMAHTVEEASLFILPDGPDSTKLDVRKGQPRDLPVFRRGNPSNPGEIVPRRFIEVLSQETPRRFVNGSGRREFVQGLFDEAKGLTARVYANRIWSNHFGRGLVKTTSDFGIQGDRPSHPELLEWLAAELVAHAEPDISWNWTGKRIHRLLVTSATYRQSSAAATNRASTHASESSQNDPENQWLARMTRRRLDVEPWRDEMLAVADNLDETLGGPAMELDLPANVRRTLYGKVGRDEQNDLLRLYDFPPPTSHSPARDATTTPLQQLFLLNSDFIETQAIRLSERIDAAAPEAATPEKIRLCYQFLFQRDPGPDEIKLGERFLQSTSRESTDKSRWPLYIQSLLGLNELMFID